VQDLRVQVKASDKNIWLRLRGDATIFASAFLFYFSTVVVRWSRESADIDAAYFVFARFVLGFATVCSVMAVRRIGPRVKSLHLLIGRAVSNTVAVFCFYKAVTVTTVAEGNILNMTFPLFVALFSWIVLKAQRDMKSLGMVLVAFAGVWLVIAPDLSVMKIGNLWGLASGITAAVAIIYLNVSRQYHDTHTILFFMFGLGTVIIFLVYRSHIFFPDGEAIFYLLLCAVTGVAGQYLLTLGFRYVTAVEGSIVASARILLAALLGPYLAGDPPLTIAGWVGAVMIFGANVYLAARKVATA